ncbi:amino acid transporter [Kibdelosporangium banguiense]|uniref:Amino acid transporter n=2 Tax=Kibdelosporangium banguiense TaxID=1365924 RepID=A0ABS4T8E1_9PSEU|nr:amino acid transporter [Kibdelosporangium banguiense]
MTYVVTFPSLLVLRKKMPDVPRPFRIPGGWGTAWVVTLLPTLLVAFTVATLIWPGLGVGWFDTDGNPDDSLPSAFAGQRLSYTLSQLIPLGASVLVGVLFVLWGQRQTHTDQFVEVPQPVR